MGGSVAARQKKSPHPYQLVEIKWLDAETEQGWEESKDHKDDLPEAITVGFLNKETDTYLTVASTIAGQHSNGRIKIPIGMVISRDIL